MTKTLAKTRFCKLSRKQVEENLDDFVARVSAPKHICDRCCRVSSSKQNLCKPKKLGKG